MTLIYCPDCETIISMDHNKTFCRCKSSWGKKDTYGGKAYPMVIPDSMLLEAAMSYERLKSKTHTFEIRFLTSLSQRFKHE